MIVSKPVFFSVLRLESIMAIEIATTEDENSAFFTITLSVIPAPYLVRGKLKQESRQGEVWIPACAGMTVRRAGPDVSVDYFRDNSNSSEHSQG